MIGKAAWIACALASALVGGASALMLGFALADVYALAAGVVAPGEHMMGDRAAPALSWAVGYALVLAALLAGCVTLFRAARGRVRDAEPNH